MSNYEETKLSNVGRHSFNDNDLLNLKYSKKCFEVNGEEIGFSILPNIDEVKAEIFKIHKTKYGAVNIRLISKSFGGLFRKPIKQDYFKAKIWVGSQLESIENANKL